VPISNERETRRDRDEVEITYDFDPGQPQLTVGQLRALLAKFPQDLPVTVTFGVDGPHEKVADTQIATDVDEDSEHRPGGQPLRTVTILANYRPGEYVRYERL
jgi:hypothetical protein